MFFGEAGEERSIQLFQCLNAYELFCDRMSIRDWGWIGWEREQSKIYWIDGKKYPKKQSCVVCVRPNFTIIFCVHAQNQTLILIATK